MALALCALTGTACSAVGWELPNYGFYGFVPRPDGRQVAPGTVAERVQVVTSGDTTDLHEGEFRIDTSRVGGERIFIVTRRTMDAEQRPVVDSAWFDGWSLRTLSTAHHGPDGILRQRFDRRAVHAERVLPNGRAQRRKTIYEAEPYGGIGIEVVLAALPLTDDAEGQLPIVDGFGEDLYILSYKVLTKQTEARSVAGGITFRPVWLLETRARGVATRFWIDGESRAILRRESPGPTDGTKLLVSRGAAVPSVQVFPVEALGGGMPAPGRSIRQGPARQVVPEPLPPPVAAGRPGTAGSAGPGGGAP